MRLLSRPMSLLLLFVMLAVSSPVHADPITIPEVHPAVGRMLEHGLVKGTNTGVNIEANIDRSSLMTIMVRAWQREPEALQRQSEVHFPDTATSWAKGYIAVAKDMAEENGFALGTPDGFNPTGNVTGPEVVAFLLKFMGISRKMELSWPDDYLVAAVEAGVISAEDRESLLQFRNVPATRGAAFYLADKAFASFKLKGDGRTIYERLAGKPKQEGKLVISGNPAELRVGDWTHITITAYASDGREVKNVPITVRVEGALASYDAKQHTITAGDEAGAGIIYASAAGYQEDSVLVTVVEGQLFALQVTPHGITLPPGTPCKFVVKGLDEAGHEVTLAPGTVVWTASQGTVATDGSYVIPADASGAVTITARVGEVEGTAVILVGQ